MTLTPFASGSSGNCYLLEDSGRRLLIECGIRFPLIQKALRFDLASLDGCLVSHAHGDHAQSVEKLLKAGVNCYASDATWGKLSISHHRAKLLCEKKQQAVGAFQVLPFEVPHDEPGTLGFLIGGPSGKSALFLTDAAYSPHRFVECSILVVEANYCEEILRHNIAMGYLDAVVAKRTVTTHMSIQRLIPMLKATDLSKVEKIVLIHLSDGNSNQADFVRQVVEATGRPTSCAPQMMEGLR